MYNNTDWKDHVVEHPKTYTQTVNQDETITLTDAPGEIIQQGTPMSATHFNNLEAGVLEASAALDELIAYVYMKIGHSLHTMESLDAAKLEASANAVSATKLLTARKIGITGGATGAGVDFDGTTAININITGIDASKLNAGTAAVARGGTGAGDAAGARTNIGAAAQAEFAVVQEKFAQLLATLDYYMSCAQMESRGQESRIAVLEAQVAALTA